MSPSTDNRDSILQRVLHAIHNDDGIVGALDYGSSSEGREDQWSDIDIALYIRDDVLAAFETEWKTWAAQFGTLLLAYIGGVQHPWVVYAAEPYPVRADFAFHPASNTDNLLAWPNAPLSVQHMVILDRTDGALSRNVASIVGQSLAPVDLHQAFEQVCGDFWYYMLRTYTKVLRGEHWNARYDFNTIIIGNLQALLRLECGAVDRFRGSSAAAGIEHVISSERLAQLNLCIPAVGEDEVIRAMAQAVLLGQEVSAAIAAQHGWSWPQELAAQVEQILWEQIQQREFR